MSELLLSLLQTFEAFSVVCFDDRKETSELYVKSFLY